MKSLVRSWRHFSDVVGLTDDAQPDQAALSRLLGLSVLTLRRDDCRQWADNVRLSDIEPRFIYERPLRAPISGVALAPPANALHFAVENGVFLLQGIIRIGQSFLRRHLIGAWLAMTNRGLRNCRICCAR